MALAMDCRMSVLPAFGGETIRPRWPLPIGATRSMTRGPIFLGSVSRRRRSDGYSGTSLREFDAVLELLGRLAVDRGDADQGVELLAGGLLAAVLAVARCADGADDGVALAQVVLLDLGEGDVDVVRARQVAGGADERVVLQHVQDAGDGQQDVVLGDLDVVDVGTLGASAAAVVAVAEAVVAGVASRLSRLSCRSRRSLRSRRLRRLPAAAAVASSLSRAVVAARFSRVPARCSAVAAAAGAACSRRSLRWPCSRGLAPGAARAARLLALFGAACSAALFACAVHAARLRLFGLAACGLRSGCGRPAVAWAAASPRRRLRVRGWRRALGAFASRYRRRRSRRPASGGGAGFGGGSGGGCLGGGSGDDAVAACTAAAATAGAGAFLGGLRPASAAGAAGAAAGAAACGTVPLSLAFSAARAGALLTGVPARWAEMAVTRSPLRMREPPEMPSWLARAWSWASLRPARPLLLAGAAVDSAAEDVCPQLETAQWFRSRRILPPRRRPD